MNINTSRISDYPLKLRPVIVIFLFGFIFFLISLVNHFLFRTYALDLGFYNQAVYSLSRFQPARYTLDITGVEMSFFATHWSPIVFLYVPFYYLFGSYALLIVQILSILSGGYSIYLISLHRGLSKKVSLLILIFFYSLWGIYSALAFDFHNTVIAAMLVPWFILTLEKKKRYASIVLFILIIMCQENMSLWMMFILIALMLGRGHRYKEDKKLLGILFMVSLSWFIIVSFWIMPSLLPDGIPNQLSRYSHLGDSFFEIARHLFLHPKESINLMFTNTTGELLYNGIKPELYLVLFASGGIALLIRPHYLVMLIPIFLQKGLSSDYAFWGINYHYSIEFAPILALAIIDTILLFKRDNTKLILMVAISLITLVTTISVIESRKSKWYNRRNTRFYHSEHYSTEYSRSRIKEGLKLIPKGEIISSSSELAAHLSGSKKIYHFPVLKDARFIVLFKETEVTFPLSKEDYMSEINTIRELEEYKIIFESKDLLIFELI